jgi:hypothetical protein
LSNFALLLMVASKVEGGMQFKDGPIATSKVHGGTQFEERPLATSRVEGGTQFVDAAVDGLGGTQSEVPIDAAMVASKAEGGTQFEDGPMATSLVDGGTQFEGRPMATSKVEVATSKVEGGTQFEDAGKPENVRPSSLGVGRGGSSACVDNGKGKGSTGKGKGKRDHASIGRVGTLRGLLESGDLSDAELAHYQAELDVLGDWICDAERSALGLQSSMRDRLNELQQVDFRLV